MKAVVVCDNRISEKIERRLLIEGYYIIKLPASSSLPEAISSHPDSLIFRVGNTFVTTCEYCEEAAYVFSDLRELCPEIRLGFVDVTLDNSYPDDAKMNAVVIGKHLVANKKTVAKEILEISEKTGLTPLNVNQGYPNCSILKLNDKNVITADIGIANKLRDLGVNVLLIEPGHISLPPYEYGFIGGASGVCGDKVYFLGNIKLHPDGERMEKFIRDSGLIPVNLSDEPLVDLGGLMFIS